MSKLLTCEVCNKEFEKQNVRGRPPKTCPSCKEKQAKRAIEAKETKEQANENGFTPVPLFSTAESVEEFSVGDIVYSLPTFTTNEVAKRRFAKDYKVLSITGQNVEVVRNANLGHINRPVTVSFTRLVLKTGVEYLDIGPDNVIMESEGNDD